jgi:hypothetical protein
VAQFTNCISLVYDGDRQAPSDLSKLLQRRKQTSDAIM